VDLRISALEKQGKLDEAIALLDSLCEEEPGVGARSAARAGQIARAIGPARRRALKANKTKESDVELQARRRRTTR
jgi:hypothetical protein